VSKTTNLYQALLKGGWTALDCRTHPRAYADCAGHRFGTLERNGVRVGLTVDQILVDHRGSVIVYENTGSNDVILRALIVDPEHRRKGRASQTMEDVVRWANRAKATVYLEPAPIEDRAVQKSDLATFYERFGFEFSSQRNLVMVRQPQPRSCV
jgi:GNAT superfamily N-acetyltransferase